MLIGITGGIGSGKSYVAKILNSKGYKVIYSDLVTRRLLEKGNANYDLVIEEFGNTILDNEGNIDRRKLRSLILENEGKRRKLNSLTHGNIIAEIVREGKESNGIIFVELPLLYEEGLEDLFDDVWLVDTPVEKQIERIVERDSVTKEEAKLIIDKQLPREIKIKKASKIINNYEDSRKDIEKEIDRLLKEYINE